MCQEKSKNIQRCLIYIHMKNIFNIPNMFYDEQVIHFLNKLNKYYQFYIYYLLIQIIESIIFFETRFSYKDYTILFCYRKIM